MFRLRTAVFATLLCLSHRTLVIAEKYSGQLAGDFRTKAHGVKGTVYVVNENTFFIENFEYDGEGPDAYFWGDTTEEPTKDGFILPNEWGSKSVVGKSDGRDILITLTDGRLVKDMKSLSVWCKKFSVNFGGVALPPEPPPAPKSLGPLPSLAHGVSSDDVILVDSKTLFISKLRYDGAGPDAFFLVGKGISPHSKGIKVPDENGRLEKLKGYEGQDVTLRLPGDLTVFDIEWMGLYCIRFEQNFGHVLLPARPNVPADLRDLRSRIAYSSSAPPPSSPYYGAFLADFRTHAHGVQGSVFAADQRTFYVVGFSYDGQGPDAYFWAGTTDKPSPNGFIVPDEFGTKQVLGKYDNQSITLTLPEGKQISDIRWLSVWCRKFAVNFGHVTIPEEASLPAAARLGPLRDAAPGVASRDVVVRDSRTLLVEDFRYDDDGPGAFFFVGKGTIPHANDTQVPDENGRLTKLRAYRGEDLLLQLPDPLTVFQVDRLSLATSDRRSLGRALLPRGLLVPAAPLPSAEMKFDNCEEMIPGVLHVRWKILGHDLFLQLVGQAAEDEYLSFGRSGHDDRAVMVGADVAVAFFDGQLQKPRVVDYYLSAKSQCSQGSGACPDAQVGDGGGADNLELVSGERKDGLLKVTFKRPLAAGDGQDLPLPVSIPVSAVAAVGPLNSRREAAFHARYYTREAKKIHLGRSPPQDRCGPTPTPSSEAVSAPWGARTLDGPTTFRAQIGPTGGPRGYEAVTGFQSWGVAWWVDGMLIPELRVRRGTAYTFVVEGGGDPSNPAAYHPLYITNNAEGGGGQFLDQLDTPGHLLLAGVKTGNNQSYTPLGVGRLCEWKHKTVDQSEASRTFEEFKSTLRLVCEDGHPGSFEWMPDEDTPDLVYYQCFTHRNLGWKIHVLDAEQPLGDAPSPSSWHRPLPWLLLVLLFARTAHCC